jgi:riboflavin biosynthesis pyrimidine reductase
VRVLSGPPGRAPDPDDDDLAALYAPPRLPWLRVNMVATLDGAVSGADGRTGSVNNAVDRRVFRLLRRRADAIVVGAGTARTERYAPAVAPLVVVSRRGEVPPLLREAAPGAVLLATCASAPLLDEARSVLGPDHVLVLGEDEVFVGALPGLLHQRGMTGLLCEGGPTLLGSLLAAGVVDELCLTLVPSLVGGRQGRIVTGPDLGVPMELGLLLEEGSTLLGRWFVTG